MNPLEALGAVIFRGFTMAQLVMLESWPWLLLAAIIWAGLRLTGLPAPKSSHARWLRLGGLVALGGFLVLGQLGFIRRWDFWAGVMLMAWLAVLTLPLKAIINRREEGVHIPLVIETMVLVLALAPIVGGITLVTSRW